MLAFVTKTEYWTAEEGTSLSRLAKAQFSWHLKSIQDAIAFMYLHDIFGGRVAEVGGGNSRILPALARDNECFNIDRFDGRHGGPKNVPEMKGITSVVGYVGDPADAELLVRDCDAVFSVSVIEHVPTADLVGFFQACADMLRPGGRMVHLIDVYLTDRPEEQHGLAERINRYAAVFDSGLLEPWTPDAPIITGESVAFSCAYATNPDNIMAAWNRSVPALRQLRTVAQSCALKLVGRKPK